MTLALSIDKEFAGMLAYNRFSNRIIMQKKPWWNREGRTDYFDDTDLDFVRLELEQRYGLSVKDKVLSAISIVANRHSFHPIQDILESLEWDGKDRISNLFPKYLGAERCEYTTEITKVFLMGAISRVYEPGVKFDSMLVLIDNIGGGGKSSIARIMAINDDYFTDDVRNLDDPKIVEKLSGHWIIEMGEMQAISNNKSIETTKAFISRQRDSYRIPWGTFSKDYPRQCVFIGTSNDTQFLPQDSSGYRRFMPLRVNKAKAEVHPLANEKDTREYVNQVWAQAMTIYRSGDYSLVLSADIQSQLDCIVKEYAPEDIKFLAIQNWLESHQEVNKVCRAMLYELALNNEDFTKAKPYELDDIARVMNRMPGWILHPTQSHQVRFERYGRVMGWDRVEKPDKTIPPFEELADATGNDPFSDSVIDDAVRKEFAKYNHKMTPK